MRSTSSCRTVSVEQSGKFEDCYLLKYEEVLEVKFKFEVGL